MKGYSKKLEGREDFDELIEHYDLQNEDFMPGEGFAGKNAEEIIRDFQ